MGYRSVLTVATDGPRIPATIDAAAAFALRHDAHLEVLALGVDRSQLGYYALSGSEAVIQLSQEQAVEEAARVSADVHAALARQGADLRASVEGAVVQMGSLASLVAMRARFADLVILPRPYGTRCGPEAEAAVEAAMFEGQAPVLVLPQDPVDSFGHHIAVAWNQSREAMSAIRRALPLLIAAKRVQIVVIDPPTHGAERTDPGGMLCRMLVRHGVQAEVVVLAKTMPKISDILGRHIRESGADMLVMGAYGHSRFREAILGGATRAMLEQATVPVVMAH